MSQSNSHQETPEKTEHSETTSSHPLGSTPINQLFFKLAFPMMLAMLFNGLYNLVDTYFVSVFVGKEAVAAVSVAFPFYLTLIAIAAAIGNGASVLVSQSIGAGNIKRAESIIGSSMTFISLACLLIALVAYVFQDSITQLLGVSLPMASDVLDYLLPLFGGCFLLFYLSLFCDLLRAQGFMKGLFLVIVFSAIANVVLDALLIALFDWGILGAALATLVAHLIGILIALNFLHASKSSVKIRFTRFVFKHCKRVVSIGSPVLFKYMGGAVIIALINAIIVSAQNNNTTEWLGAYGILGRLNIFIILPLLAMTSACQTIVSFNFGANNHQRVFQTVKVGLISAFVYLVVVTSGLLIFPEEILTVFTQDKNLIKFGVEIARQFFLLLPLAASSAIAVAFFQGVGMPRYALVVSITKIYVLLIPVIFIVETFLGFEKLFFAFPMTEILSLVVTFILVWRFLKTNRLQSGMVTGAVS